MNNELLKYAVENGRIDLSYVQEQIERNKRKEVLEKHPYSINQGNDGRWITYIPDQEKGRKMIRKKTKEELENIIFDFWKKEIENPTVSDIFNEWLESKRSYNDICTGTYDRYKRDFKRFLKIQQSFLKRKLKRFLN